MVVVMIERASGLSLQVVALLVLLQGAASSASGAELRVSPPGHVASASALAIQALLISNDGYDLAASPVDLSQLRSLYAERGFEPIWSGSDEALERAEIVRAAL